MAGDPSMCRTVVLACTAVALLLPVTGEAQGYSANRAMLDSLRARVAADSNEPGVHYDLAMELIARKRWDAADSALAQVVLLDPQHADAWMEISLLPERRGEGYWRTYRKERGPAGLDTLVAQLRRAQRKSFLLDPTADLHLVRFVREATRRPMFFIPWWFGGYERALKEAARSRPGQAHDELSKILADPRAAAGRAAPGGVLHFHGILSLELGKYDAATADFALLTGRAFYAETLGTLPVLAANDARYALATSRLLAGQLHEAAATFRRVLEFDASVWQAHTQLARVHEALGLFEEAVAERQRALDVNPEEWSLLLELGASLTRAGRIDEAEEVLERVVVRAPRSARAWLTLGMVAEDRGNVARAREAYARFVAVAPRRMGHQVTQVNGRLAGLQ
jgi:tetratricopeptide (TPR) repeat protein